jgi:hypothetical protein
MMNAAHRAVLHVEISEAQLGYLAYCFPNDDPEIALVKLLERERLHALRQADANVQVLNVQPQKPALLPTFNESVPKRTLQVDSDNPIGALQEYCQQRALPLPIYEFEPLSEGFQCIVSALDGSATGTGLSKKVAKTEAARHFLRMWQPSA